MFFGNKFLNSQKKDYLSISLDGLDCLPEKPFVVNYESEKQQLNCSLAWTEFNTNVVVFRRDCAFIMANSAIFSATR
jgi:hypothetical protein